MRAHPDDPLAISPLFAALKPKERVRLAREMRERVVPAGATLVEQGAGATAFFVVIAGEAVVEVDGVPVRRLGPGDHAGELALLARSPRNATVRAVTELRCLGLVDWSFRAFVAEHPDVAWALLEELAQRAVSGRPAPVPA